VENLGTEARTVFTPPVEKGYASFDPEGRYTGSARFCTDHPQHRPQGEEADTQQRSRFLTSSTGTMTKVRRDVSL